MSAVPADAVPDPPSAPTSADSASPEAEREALERYRALVPHLHDQVTLKAAATRAGVPYRTLQRWLAAYRQGGLAALARPVRRDKGRRKHPAELVAFIEGLGRVAKVASSARRAGAAASGACDRKAEEGERSGLRRRPTTPRACVPDAAAQTGLSQHALALKEPRPAIAVIHRQAVSVAAQQGWPAPGYRTVHEIVSVLDPALMVLAHEGAKRYREVYDLVYRREAKAPNEIWQADHTQLDLWVLDASGKPARPWLTVIEDDHSRAVAGYAVSLEALSALSTALAFRHAIWRKSEPDWHVCGIPTVFHLDHGADFTSTHLEQVMADLRVRPVFAKKGQPHGHGKIERLIGTVTHMCLPHLPGHAPRGTPDRAGQAKLTLPELDAAIGRFIREVYNQRPHAETRQPPQERWEADAFIPRMPESLEQLDLLLTTVAKPRKIHTDGIRFESLRFIDPVLADYVGEQTTIRYDPRDITEIRVYLRTLDGEKFLCRAICPDLATDAVSLKEITAARNARRKQLRGTLKSRTAVVDKLLAVHSEPPARPVADRDRTGPAGRPRAGCTHRAHRNRNGPGSLLKAQTLCQRVSPPAPGQTHPREPSRRKPGPARRVGGHPRRADREERSRRTGGDR
ncbi:Mu transposase C-terminal domain-containing protein [Streptomyces sp. FIT100]|uniref:Mu transposase C-terminal domain-containing protein n=1 Tax=Streptomyces sp. FIT100 TaxID=2837956 RepID=UPI0021CADEAF|nr:Mu transposase C-terminal domain-containing protein [Streptomyces sp. FIT100]UUN30932.1 DDE-type integrase/transposase/recombinase [Streptomyces sp. FIT100]